MSDQFCDVGRGVTLCYRSYGTAGADTIMLIAGIGLDLNSWPVGMIEPMVAAGFRVIVFDNRDSGASTRITTSPPNLLQKALWMPRRNAYDLGDMAEDAAALIDHLSLRTVHLVGMSMGGMIAQTIASRHPNRVSSLTSIFSTTGNRKVGQPALSTLLRMVGRPAQTKEVYVKRHLALLDHIGSSTHPYDPARERAWAAASWDRGPGAYGGECLDRQISAIQKSGDRTAELARVTASTLVLHGDVDLMVNPSGGRSTAAAIPDARHMTIEGLSHHLPPSLDARITDLIIDNVLSAGR